MSVRKNEFKRCEASKSANSGNDEQSQFGSGFFSAVICFLCKSEENSSHHFRFIMYEFFFKTKNVLFFLNRLALNLFFCPVCLSSMRSHHWNKTATFSYEPLSRIRRTNLKERFSIIFLLCFFSFFALWRVSFLNKIIVKSTSLCGLVIHFSIQELVFLPAEN